MAITMQLSQATPSLQVLCTLFCVSLAAFWTPLQPFLSYESPSLGLGSVCENPQYTVRTLSFDPLIQHVENFITPNEIQHLLSLANEGYSRSTTISSNGSETIDDFRTSSTAFIPRDDFVSQCIFARAAEYQGYVDVDMIESLQVTRYLRSQHFGAHFDWHQDNVDQGSHTNDRETTFFATLEANCTSCGTHFPNLMYDWRNEDARWCRIVDCDEKDGLTVNPIAGSALFWVNLHANGVGDRRMLHAGLPVPDGSKTGLNIWTTRSILSGETELIKSPE